jgi:hypothetical protein
MPVCSCLNEVGKLQYPLLARQSFEAFLEHYSSTRDKSKDVEVFQVLFKQDEELLACCRRCLLFPRYEGFPKEQISTSQRLLPTALPAPLLTGDVVEWY